MSERIINFYVDGEQIPVESFELDMVQEGVERYGDGQVDTPEIINVVVETENNG